jgi:hypothetical protein
MRRSNGIAGGVVLLLMDAALLTGCLSNSRTPEAGTAVVERPDGTIMATAEKMDIERSTLDEIGKESARGWRCAIIVWSPR